MPSQNIELPPLRSILSDIQPTQHQQQFQHPVTSANTQLLFAAAAAAAAATTPPTTTNTNNLQQQQYFNPNYFNNNSNYLFTPANSITPSRTNSFSNTNSTTFIQQPLTPVSRRSSIKDSPSTPLLNQEVSTSNTTTNSKKCRCRNFTNKGRHIPRPRNAFILYRQHLHHTLFGKAKNLLLEQGSFKTNSQVSREIGQKWRNLPTDEKQYWHDLAKKEKELHKLKYPNYKYLPRKNSAPSTTTNTSTTTTNDSFRSSHLNNNCKYCDDN